MASGRIASTFRRFFFDGTCVGKFEFGFWVRPRPDSEDIQLDSERTDGLIEAIVTLRTEVAGRQLPLINVGAALASAYLRASTSKRFGADNTLQEWVRGGTPLVIVEADGFEDVHPPPGAECLVKLGDQELFHFTRRSGDVDYRGWLLRTGLLGGGHDIYLRPFRFSLARFHAERSALEYVLRLLAWRTLAPPPRGAASQALQEYLGRTATFLGGAPSRAARAERRLELARRQLAAWREGDGRHTRYRLEAAAARARTTVASAAGFSLALEANQLAGQSDLDILRANLEKALLDMDARQNVRRKVHQVMVRNRQPTTDAPVDVAFVTVLPVERAALLAELTPYEELPPSGDDIRIYYRSRLSFDDGRALSAVCVKSLGAGNLPAANVTADVLRRWSPRFLVLCGIAGGVHDEVSIGDVIVASQVLYYEMAKLKAESDLLRLEAFRPSARVLAAADSFTLSAVANWGSPSLVRLLARGRLAREPRVFCGPIGSGDKVVANADAGELERLRRVHDKVLAVEMEAAGVSSAIFEAKAARPVELVVIRGISDHVRSPKTDDFHEEAASAAAALSMALLRKLSMAPDVEG